ncbi:hypothetical protein DFH94DRAFT_481949 [Russula ochroleuca]|uniref:Uncharacterized protein n=1 Tax=Russula ochroleuca TaxID=152965 RepID=A0A9P5MME2_9AGAM|nr:hypothetical protein DFH94DRAFT_481949 [Russula ochroleuca]
MSLLATPLAFLVFFSGFAVAQISAPNCYSEWAWSFNSLGQNPCLVAATMLGTCNGGSFTVFPLQAGGSYLDPSGDDSNLCKCNTVAYSLLSACEGCQGGDWITWSEYSLNCTKTLPPSQFPNPVPTGTRVPFWALVDPTVQSNNNTWNLSISHTFRDSAELGPGMIIRASSASVSGSKTGLIAGGIVGGITAVSLVAALFFYRRRRRSQASSAAHPAPESASDRLGGFVAFNTPMLSHIPSRASSARNIYTVSPVPAPQPHG